MNKKITEIDKKKLLDSKNSKILWEDEKKEVFNELNSTMVSVCGAIVLYSIVGFILADQISYRVFASSKYAFYVTMLLTICFGLYRGFTNRSRFINAYFNRNAPIYGYTEGQEVYIAKAESNLLTQVSEKGADKFKDDLKKVDLERRLADKKIKDEKYAAEKSKRDQEQAENKRRQAEKQKLKDQQRAIEDDRKKRGAFLEKASFEIINSFGFDPALKQVSITSFKMFWESYSDDKLFSMKREPRDVNGFNISVGEKTYSINDLKKFNYDHNEVIDQEASSTFVGFETKGDEITNTLLKSQGLGDWGLSSSKTEAVYENTKEEGRDIYNATFEFMDGCMLAGKAVFRYEGNDTLDTNRQLRSIFFLIWNEIAVRDYETKIADLLRRASSITEKKKIIADEEEMLRESIRKDSGKNATTRFCKLDVLTRLRKTFVESPIDDV